MELTEEGMDVEGLTKALQKDVKFVYAIPEFQNPTGMTYSRKNRDQIYQVLKDRDVVLIEDDPYGELRFEGDTCHTSAWEDCPTACCWGHFQDCYPRHAHGLSHFRRTRRCLTISPLPKRPATCTQISFPSM